MKLATIIVKQQRGINKTHCTLQLARLVILVGSAI